VKIASIIIVILFGIALILGAVYWYGSAQQGQEMSMAEQRNIKINHYENGGVSLANIKVTAVYFIPKDEYRLYKEGQPGGFLSDWKERVNAQLERIKQFHESQFAGYSKLQYAIQEDPETAVIVGEQNSIEYVKKTNGGSSQGEVPETLRIVGLELERRFPGITLPDSEPGVYRVLVIYYQPVGAVSSENVVLLGTAFIEGDTRIKGRGDTTLYHEFAHTLGLPDRYVYSGVQGYDQSTGYDIMGKARNGELEVAYIDYADKKKMGLY
jgi:hypothetical protein